MIKDEKIIDLFFERSEQGIQELDIKYGKVCHKPGRPPLSLSSPDDSRLKLRRQFVMLCGEYVILLRKGWGLL